MRKKLLINGKIRIVQISAEYEIYNCTLERPWAIGYVSLKDKMIFKELLPIKTKWPQISEMYKINIELDNIVYPYISISLDNEEPIDRYKFIKCGVLKNDTQVNNFVIAQKPVNHPMAIGRMKGDIDIHRDVPQMPLVKFPYDRNLVFHWAEKPYGLVFEWVTIEYEKMFNDKFIESLIK